MFSIPKQKALKLLAKYFSYNGSEFSSCCLHKTKYLHGTVIGEKQTQQENE